MSEILMEAVGVKKYFPVKRSMPFEPKRYVKAVDGVDITIHKNETVGLVGESGCGKSTLGRALINLVPATDGKVIYRGNEIQRYNFAQMRPLRRELQMVFQDPYASLNPRMTIYEAVKAPLEVYREGTEEEKFQKVKELLDYVGIGSQHMQKYPHELSGGQRQRVVIARAIILNPSFVVCDEPVSALDVSVRSQVLNLMKKLQEDTGLSYLFISHDLSVVRYLCSHILVMYLGKVVEEAPKAELFTHAVHPYTRALLSAIPIPDIHVKTKRIILTGDVPSPLNPPGGCRFHTRCPYATEVCSAENPPCVELTGGHKVFCHHAADLQ